MPPNIAIIMRAKNEMPHVQYALEMLKRQTYREFSLHAVDSGSTDGTLEELRRHCDQLGQIAPDEYIPGKVLNSAIEKTRHEIIVLLNADAIPQSEDWLARLLEPILEDRADAAFSKQVARPDARFIVAYDYERAYDPSNIEPTFFSAVACAFRRDLWETHHFPPEGYAEDTAWARSGIEDGVRVQFAEQSVVEHSHNYTMDELYRKRFRQSQVIGATPTTGKLLRELVRDLLHAIVKLKPHTIPYNIVYRITIHRAFRKGLKA